LPQLSFAKRNNIEIKFGNPDEEVPGQTIIMPEHPSNIKARYSDMDKLKKSYIKHSVNRISSTCANQADIDFLVEDTKSNEEFVKATLKELNVEII
jgi:hypothetical protein